jgi:hypothetical protein
MKNLRILFTILCAICLAALPLVGIFCIDFIIIPIIIAGITFLLMLHFRNKQILLEEKNQKQPKGDYFSPLQTEEPNKQDTEVPLPASEPSNDNSNATEQNE